MTDMITEYAERTNVARYGESFLVNGMMYDATLLCPATKSGGVLCYTLRTFECLSVRLSVRPSAVDHSCPLYNFDTVQDNFTKLGTNVKHDQTTCRD